MNITELGCAGHFIVAERCHFRRHTQVGDEYRVSTVGNLHTHAGIRETVGSGDNDWFESMVFRTLPNLDPGNDGCGCYEVADWTGIDGARYATAGEAQKGHEELVEKYRKLAEL